MTMWRSAKSLSLIMVCLWLASITLFNACAYQTAPPAPAPTQPAPSNIEGKTTPLPETKSESPRPPAPSQSPAPSSAPPVTTQPPLTQQPPATPTPAPQQPSGTAVDISGFAFSPATISVPVGATVTWTNRDSAPHTVTSLAGAFDSGSLARGATFTFTFSQAGTFQYRCDIHPSMTARVVVGESATSSAGGTTTPSSGGSSSGSSGGGDYNY